MESKLCLMTCAICGKQIVTEEWIAEEGPLKGERIVRHAFCSDYCEDVFAGIVIDAMGDTNV